MSAIGTLELLNWLYESNQWLGLIWMEGLLGRALDTPAFLEGDDPTEIWWKLTPMLRELFTNKEVRWDNLIDGLIQRGLRAIFSDGRDIFVYSSSRLNNFSEDQLRRAEAVFPILSKDSDVKWSSSVRGPWRDTSAIETIYGENYEEKPAAPPPRPKSNKPLSPSEVNTARRLFMSGQSVKTPAERELVRRYVQQMGYNA